MVSAASCISPNNALLNDIEFRYLFLCGFSLFVLTGVTGTTSLDPEETLHIAMVACQNLKYSLCISWMQEALRQLDSGADSLGSLTPLLQRENPPPALSFTQLHLSQGRVSGVSGILSPRGFIHDITLTVLVLLSKLLTLLILRVPQDVDVSPT